MASLIPGYEYDIFISYRQKDNKYDGWVTEFVDNLKKELESMFKYEVSVYFDINPSDYLLESYDVDASLKDKLKCLVFIPIISRTYCDSKSFAWEQEFKAFVEQASHDQFGLKIKLPNGNVASRVLPIRIHDLDPDDIKLCESVLGGVLRGVDFIYKEPGVNRSLSPKDHEEKNLNNTNYRNQINKVALAIKEIISGLKTEPVDLTKEKIQHQESSKEVKREEGKEVQEKPYNQPKRKVLLGGIFIAVLIVIAAIFAYPKIFKQNTLEKLRSSSERISVAVLPFQNLTNDSTLSTYGEIIQFNLTSMLSGFPQELKVKQIESIDNILQSKKVTNYAFIESETANIISRNLETDVYIFGNIARFGDNFRIYAQILNSKTNYVIKSFTTEIASKEEDFNAKLDSLALLVRNFLVISKMEKENSEFNKYTVTGSPEAYKYYILGRNAYYAEKYLNAIEWFKKALNTDSNFYWAMVFLVNSYDAINNYQAAKEYCQVLLSKKDKMNEYQKIYTYFLYAEHFETPYLAIYYLQQLQQIDDQPHIHHSLAWNYYKLNQYDKEIIEFEKELELYNKMKTKPWNYWTYYDLGQAYNKTGNYKKEKELYDKELKNYPLYYFKRKAILALSEKDTISANSYIEKYRLELKKIVDEHTMGL